MAGRINFASSVRWGVLLSMTQKILSFALNQAMVRSTSPEVLGVAAIQLELFLSSITFLSREGIRLALLREPVITNTTTSAHRQRFLNLSWVPFVIVASVMFGLTTLSHFYDVNSTALLLYCAGALLEAAGEPWVNLFQNSAKVVPKMQAEAAALFVKSCVTFLAVAYMGLGVNGFGIAQVAYGSSYLFVLIQSSAGTFTGLRKALPGRPILSYTAYNSEAWVDRGTVDFALTATGSCVLKHVLTEADKIFLSIFRTSHDQGIFAVANNYASLVVRIFFLPVEDSARVAFSKTSGVDALARATQLQQILIQLLRIVALIGIAFPLFGMSYVRLAVRYLLNEKWRGVEIERTLMAFCFHIFVLSVNGVSEAFCQVAARSSDFTRVNVGLLLSSLVYMFVSLLLCDDDLGSSGVVIANSAAVSVRIFSSLVIVRKTVGNVTGLPVLTPFKPSFAQAFTVGLASFSCYVSSLRYAASAGTTICALEHLSVGVVSALFLASLHWRQVAEQLDALFVNSRKK